MDVPTVFFFNWKGLVLMALQYKLVSEKCMLLYCYKYVVKVKSTPLHTKSSPYIILLFLQGHV